MSSTDIKFTNFNNSHFKYVKAVDLSSKCHYGVKCSEKFKFVSNLSINLQSLEVTKVDSCGITLFTNPITYSTEIMQFVYCAIIYLEYIHR